MRYFFLMALLALAPAPLAAQPAGLVAAEIIQGGQMPDGRALAAIVLTLAPGWKTYWRSAGEGGLPPEFDWSAAQNLGSVSYLWPTPQVFDIGGMRSFGYDDSLVLPIAVMPDVAAQPVALQVTMTFGLCKDICQPATVALSAPPMAQTAQGHPLIMAAMANQPMTAQAAGAANWACTSTPIKDGVQVALTLPMPLWAGAGDEVVVFEHRDTSIWAAPARVVRQGDILTAVADLVPPQAKPFDLAGDDLRLTVLAGGKAADLQGCPLLP